MTPNNQMFVSYSQIALFMKCPYLWWLEYCYGVKPIAPSSQALDKGIYFHNALEQFYLTKIHGEKDPIEVATSWVRGNPYPEMADYAHMAMLLDRYMKDFAIRKDADWLILEAEKGFKIPLVTPTGIRFTLVGKIDVVAKHRTTHKVWTWDHKTSGRGFWSPMEIVTDVQQPMYLIALNLMEYPNLGGIMVNQINMYHYKKGLSDQPVDKLFQRDTSYRTPQELDNVLANTCEIVDKMYAVRVGWETEGRIPPRNLSRDCKYCFQQDTCISNLKGTPLKDLIGSTIQFKKGYPKHENESE